MAELTSNQEEGDTHLPFHPKHAAQEGYKAVAVISEDTDVFIFLLNFLSIINTRLYMKCSSKSRTQLIDIKGAVQRTGQEICEALIGLHSFTGCDSVPLMVKER